LFGVAAGGQAGAERALQLLRAELDRTLALIGCASASALTPAYLRQEPARNPAPSADRLLREEPRSI
jgi:(S)-mandelate dehydrogenase